MQHKVKEILDYYSEKYNHTDFIKEDPISVPHRFSKKQDIEIIGFWIAMLSWGNRKTIIKKGLELCELMDQAPYDFILNHVERDRQRFVLFVQRTFNFTDALYFLHFFQEWFKKYKSLETAFSLSGHGGELDMEDRLNHFHKIFFSYEPIPDRTRKHVANPKTGSRCKRLIMFLRWMVREDKVGVDFGLWKTIKPSDLLIPLDVHVERTARQLGILSRKNLDWKSVLEVSDHCKKMNPSDPALYDYGLFGISMAIKKGDPEIVNFVRNIS